MTTPTERRGQSSRSEGNPVVFRLPSHFPSSGLAGTPVVCHLSHLAGDISHFPSPSRYWKGRLVISPLLPLLGLRLDRPSPSLTCNQCLPMYWYEVSAVASGCVFRAFRGTDLMLLVRFPNQGRQVDDLDIWTHTNDSIGSIRRQVLNRRVLATGFRVSTLVLYRLQQFL